MSQRLIGVREASLSHGLALTLFILQKSRMRRRARTDLCGGRSVMGVPTATVSWSRVEMSELPVNREITKVKRVYLSATRCQLMLAFCTYCHLCFR